MRIVVIYLEKPPAALMQLFGECSSLKAELIDYARAEELLRGLQPEAIFCELVEEHMPNSLLSELAQHRSKIPVFSFSIETNIQLDNRSIALGFIAHVDGRTTLAEIQLHLKYGNRLVHSGHLSNSYRIEQSLAA